MGLKRDAILLTYNELIQCSSSSTKSPPNLANNMTSLEMTRRYWQDFSLIFHDVKESTVHSEFDHAR